MLRFAIALIAALIVSGTAESADGALPGHRWHRAAAMLPPGLPRPHYRFRTTISYATPYVYRGSGPSVSVYESPGPWYAPAYAYVPYIAPLGGAPWLEGFSPLSGYYGSAYIYGPYYGDPNVGYWDRLPYACGVYGYC